MQMVYRQVSENLQFVLLVSFPIHAVVPFPECNHHRKTRAT